MEKKMTEKSESRKRQVKKCPDNEVKIDVVAKQ